MERRGAPGGAPGSTPLRAMANAPPPTTVRQTVTHPSPSIPHTSMQHARLQNRMARELKLLEKKPPEGVCCWPVGSELTVLKAQIQGPANTVYEHGVFELSVVLPDSYPMEPPQIQFQTRVYHPNIDDVGRICCDLLNLPPKGSWGPALDLRTVLAGIRQLLAEPNPKDPLMVDVTEQYLNNRSLFDMTARQYVRDHAQKSSSGAAAAAAASSAAAAPRAQAPAGPSAGGSSAPEGDKPALSEPPGQPAAPDKENQTPAAAATGVSDSHAGAERQHKRLRLGLH